MFRTQISLTDEDRALLDRIGAQTGRSMAALIREAVQHYWNDRPVEQRDFDAVDSAFGAWGGDRQDGAGWG